MSIELIAKKWRDEWNSHIRPEVRTLVERPEKITIAEYNELRLNSWEREEVVKRLDDEALIDSTRHILKNCQPGRSRPCNTYDNALAVIYVPLLLDRLAELAGVGEAGRASA